MNNTKIHKNLIPCPPLNNNICSIMANVNKTAIVPHSAAQMYALVNDINAYPEFLPNCSASEILSANDDEIKASLTLEWNGVKKSFSTCNRLQKDKMIEVRLEEGPFKHLEGFWRFDALSEDACKIIFDLEFEIAGALLSAVFGPVFQQIMVKLVDAFVERAKVIYAEDDNNGCIDAS